MTAEGQGARGEGRVAGTLGQLNCDIVACRRCPRLVEYRERVARDRRPMYKDQEYWGKPVPGWGDPQASVYIVGLAPAAHGGNRTGRVFTGDSSGDFLFAALYRSGFANLATSISRDDGLILEGAYIGAAVRCAPPDNKPLLAEFANCHPYLAREFELLPRIRVVIGLGQIGFNAALGVLLEHGVELPRPRPKFGHNVEYHLGKYTLIGTYHPSRQNTNTGRLTRAMFDAVFKRAGKELGR